MQEALALFTAAGSYFHWPWLVPAGIFILLHYLAEPTRWYLYSRRAADTGFAVLFHVFSVTALASYLLPFKMGTPARIWLLSRYVRKQVGLVIGFMTVDGLVYYSAWGIAALAGMGMLAVEQEITQVLWILLVVILMVFSVMLISKKKSDTQRKVPTLIQKVLSVRKYVSAGMLTLALAFAFLDIFTQVLRHYFLLHFLGQDVALGLVAAVTAIAFFAGLVSMMPLGLGGYDVMLIFLLAKLGIALDVSTILVITNRILSLGTSTGLGLVSAWKLDLRPSQLRRL